MTSLQKMCHRSGIKVYLKPMILDLNSIDHILLMCQQSRDRDNLNTYYGFFYFCKRSFTAKQSKIYIFGAHMTNNFNQYFGKFYVVIQAITFL